jgi:hypothetical protein
MKKARAFCKEQDKKAFNDKSFSFIVGTMHDAKRSNN